MIRQRLGYVPNRWSQTWLLSRRFALRQTFGGRYVGLVSRGAGRPGGIILLSLSNALAGSSPNVVNYIIGMFRRLKCPIPSSRRLRQFVNPTVIRSLRHGGVPSSLLSRNVTVCHECCTRRTIFSSPGGPNRGIPNHLGGAVCSNVPRRLTGLHTSKCCLTVTDYGPRCRYVPVYRRFRLSAVIGNVCNTDRSGSHLSGSRIVR